MGRNRGGKKKQACTGKWWCGCPKCEAKPSFGSGEVGAGGGRVREAPVHGLTEDGQEVTASFGVPGGSREDSTLLADGHIEEMRDFYGPQGDEQHDDYDGRGGGTQRGKYTGYGS